MIKVGRIEAILWNIGLPGFTQLLSGQIIKGIFFVLLEITLNVASNFNLAIMYSFLGEFDKAIAVTNYQWLMFYPCLYFFALWDAYRGAMPESESGSYFPFVFGAFFVTTGLMYSPKLILFDLLLGPVFLPILFLIPGLIVGFILKYLIIYLHKSRMNH